MKDVNTVKMTFGLQSREIEIIERHLKTDYNSFHEEWVWDKIGKEIGWCGKTALHHYLRYLNKKLNLQAEKLGLYEKS